MQVERRIFHASKLGEGLLKELDGPSLDSGAAFVLGPKEGIRLIMILTASHGTAVPVAVACQ